MFSMYATISVLSDSMLLTLNAALALPQGRRDGANDTRPKSKVFAEPHMWQSAVPERFILLFDIRCPPKETGLSRDGHYKG